MLQVLSQFSNAVLSGEVINDSKTKRDCCRKKEIKHFSKVNKKHHNSWVEKQFQSGIFDQSNAVLSNTLKIK